jgi:hypothetical protein
MAKVSDNDITRGLRGKIGKQFVFRVIRGVTYASRAPRKPDKRKETPAQRGTRATFKKASQWATAIICNPEKKKYYELRAKEWTLTNAYTAAVKEYMQNPQEKIAGVHEVNKTVVAVQTKPKLEVREIKPTRVSMPVIEAATRVALLRELSLVAVISDDGASGELEIRNYRSQWGGLVRQSVEIDFENSVQNASRSSHARPSHMFPSSCGRI